MELLSIKRLYNDDEQKVTGFIVWIEKDGNYEQWRITENINEQMKSVTTADYRGYDHFSGVMGKFNPMTIFLKKPLDLPDFDFDVLEDKWLEVEKMLRKAPK